MAVCESLGVLFFFDFTVTCADVCPLGMTTVFVYSSSASKLLLSVTVSAFEMSARVLRLTVMTVSPPSFTVPACELTDSAAPSLSSTVSFALTLPAASPEAAQLHDDTQMPAFSVYTRSPSCSALSTGPRLKKMLSTPFSMTTDLLL